MIFTQILLATLAALLAALLAAHVMEQVLGEPTHERPAAALCRLGAALTLGALAGGSVWECFSALVQWASL